MPIRAIARHLGISKNTVKRALANDRPPQYRRSGKGSAAESRCRSVSCCGRPRRCQRRRSPSGSAGMTILKDRIRGLRLTYSWSIRYRVRPIGPVSWPSATCDFPARTSPGLWAEWTPAGPGDGARPLEDDHRPDAALPQDRRP
ncbi:hypothetical protein ACWD4K_24270 [Streptomyces gelaticus]